MSILTLVITFLGSLFKSHRQLRLENLALRQQVAMLQQSVKRPRASTVDRVFWVLFSRYVDGWRNALHTLHPDTVIRWHRQGFRHNPGERFSTTIKTVWQRWISLLSPPPDFVFSTCSSCSAMTAGKSFILTRQNIPPLNGQHNS